MRAGCVESGEPEDLCDARAAEAASLAEIERLERIFSSFLPDSELARWQAQGVAQLSPELQALLRAAEGWMALGFPSEAIHHALAAGDALFGMADSLVVQRPPHCPTRRGRRRRRSAIRCCG